MARVNFQIPQAGLTAGNGNILLDQTNANVYVGNLQTTVVNANTTLGNVVVIGATPASSNSFANGGGSLRVNGGAYIRGNLFAGAINAQNFFPSPNIVTSLCSTSSPGNNAGVNTIAVGDLFYRQGNTGFPFLANVPFGGTFTQIANATFFTMAGMDAGGDWRLVPPGTYRYLGALGPPIDGRGGWQRIA